MKQRNQNRSGYKHTKIGWIPKEWECVPGKRVFSNSTEKGYNGLPILSVTIDSGIVHRNTLERKAPNAIAETNSLHVRVGDIAYNMMRTWQGAIGLVTQEGVVSPAYVVLHPKKDICSLFMFYLFKSLHYLYFLQSYSYGLTSDRLRLYYKDFAIMPMILPPFPEQERIAEVLSAWDRAIELTGKLIEAKQRLKKGLMQQLLTGRIRFPEFEPRNKRKKIDKSKLPKEWKWKKLGECLDKILGGGTPSKNRPHYWNGDIPWATVKDISRGNIGDTIDHISIDGLKESSSNLIPPGTVLMCTRMAVGKTICFECATAINQDLKALFPNKLLNKDFLLVLLRFHENYFASLGGGSTVTGIRLEELRDFRFPLPTIQEQINIASCLSAIDREIQLLTRKRNLLQEQKKGLMQKLLTGEIRVRVEK